MMDSSDEEVEVIPPSPTRPEASDAGTSRTTGAPHAGTTASRSGADDRRSERTLDPEEIQIQDDEGDLVDMADEEAGEERSEEDNSDVEIIQIPEEVEVIEIDGNMDEVAVFVTASDTETEGNGSAPPSRPATPLPDENPPVDRSLTPGLPDNPPEGRAAVSPPEGGESPERPPDPTDGENPPADRPVTPAVDLTQPPGQPATVEGAPTQERQLPPVVEENLPALPGAVQSLPAPRIRTLTPVRNSPADFRSPKRRKLMSPEKKTCTEDEDDADSCPICFEPWTNSGSHRLASLRCGHLFGQSCIEKWLRGQGGKCPHCNAKAKRLDIRVIYAKSLKALDTTERDRALADLEKEKQLRKKAELATAQARLQCRLANEECSRMRFDLNRYKQQIQELRANPAIVASITGQSSQSSQTKGQFVPDKTIKIFEAGGCRVLSYSSFLAALVMSQPSTSPLFPGFGVKKLNAVDFKTTQYVTVHSKAIRDLSFHPEAGDGYMLSCSIDKTVKLTNLVSNTVMQSYDTPMPVWSCVWNADDRNYFYAGQQNGTVLEFDIRNTESFVQELNTEGSRAPIVSLQYVHADQQAAFRPGGLLVGQLDRITFYERQAGDYKLHLLPTDSNLTSLHFEPKTRHILSSFRPTAKHPTVRHLMSELTCTNISTEPTEIENLCASNMVQTFHGGKSQKILAKTILTTCPSDNSKVLACAGDETTGTVQVWDTSSGQLIQKLPAGGAVVDMCSLQVNNQHYLATLTDKLVKIHKWS